MTVVIRGGGGRSNSGGGGNQPQQLPSPNQNITLDDNGQRLTAQEEENEINETGSLLQRINVAEESVSLNRDKLDDDKEKEVDEINFEDANGSIAFPLSELARLDEMISRPRWIIPVLPNGELEILLQTSLKLCKAGLDVKCEPCQRFFREGLTVSFTKILTDEAVSNWKLDIHVSCQVR